MKFIPNSVSTKFARTALKASNISPQVLFVTGLVGMGATVVLACKATLKVEEVLDAHEAEIAAVKNDQNSSALQRHVTMETGVMLGKLYAPAIIVGAVSISALAGSHNILSKRNAALTAAYGTVSRAFDEYRARVRESLGEDREKEIYHDVLPCEIENPETGKLEKRKVGNGGGPYAVCFDRGNPNFSENPHENEFFLRMQQEYANNRLHARGHIFLNEIYTALGFEHTKAGAIVGWFAGKEGVDNYIDFGIFNDLMREQVVDFMVGREKAIWLDFNVDGVIYDKL